MARINDYIHQLCTYPAPLKIMEVCGTHTASITKNGIRELLPSNIRLVSGPGCPVCVTGAGFIDTLTEFSMLENSCVLSFGDMFKVRGTSLSFSQAKAEGGTFEMIYSPFEAIERAKGNPQTHYVLAAVGFETTIPIYALLLETLIKEKIKNVRLALSLKTMIPAMEFICENETIDGFICPGHVSVIIGEEAFRPLCEKYKKPLVIAGFEPERIIAALCEIVLQKSTENPVVTNMYKSVVNRRGNETALTLIDRYFTKSDGYWRGIGVIKGSALVLRSEFSDFLFKSSSDNDVAVPLDIRKADGHMNEQIQSGCYCTDVLLGRITPPECRLFAKSCHTDNPIGACMTSREGACNIWYENCKE